MKISRRFQPMVHKDTTATVRTAGVLGESFIDLESRGATKPPVSDGDELPASNAPNLEDVVRSSQGTLQNVDILVKRMDRILVQVESGKGTISQFINDPAVFNKANSVLDQVQQLMNDINGGEGTVGRLVKDKELYRKLDDTVTKLNRLAEDAEAGKGSLGKFMKDEALYNNLNQTAAKANKLMDDVNAGKGAIGKLAKDEEFARKLHNTMDKLSAIADRLESGEGSAGRLLKDPSLYNNTDQLLVETRTLVKAVRENPKKYLTIHFRIF